MNEIPSLRFFFFLTIILTSACFGNCDIAGLRCEVSWQTRGRQVRFQRTFLRELCVCSRTFYESIFNGSFLARLENFKGGLQRTRFQQAPKINNQVVNYARIVLIRLSL